MSLSTKQIVELVRDTLLPTPVGQDAKEFDFAAWLIGYRALEDAVVKPVLPEAVLGNYPLRDEVLKQVYSLLFGHMPFSKEYILKHYEHKSAAGLQYLLYPATAARRLVVLFSGIGPHKTYNRYSWYWDPTQRWEGDTAYLFINDLTHRWYVGDEAAPTRPAYRTLIQSVMKRFGLSPKQVFTVGGSMGGYGALLYAVEMGLGGAICVNPQLNAKSTARHRSGDWLPKIQSCGLNFTDADDLVHLYDKLPPIYLEYCEYEADRDAAERLLDSLRQRAHFVLVKKVGRADHVTLSPKKDKVEALLALFSESAAFEGDE